MPVTARISQMILSPRAAIRSCGVEAGLAPRSQNRAAMVSAIATKPVP